LAKPCIFDKNGKSILSKEPKQLESKSCTITPRGERGRGGGLVHEKQRAPPIHKKNRRVGDPPLG